MGIDPRLLQYYERELQYVREMGAEFARDYPKIAGRLGMEGLECADPYVERLLEAFAFLAARVQLKIDAEFPKLTQHLLEVMEGDAVTRLVLPRVRRALLHRVVGQVHRGVRRAQPEGL